MMQKSYYLLLGLLFCFSSLNITAQEDNPSDGPFSTGPRIYAEHSVLSTGTWYKIAVAQSGICQISFSFLQSMGMNMAAIDPRNIRIYGNGGRMLPENNAVIRYDDLHENAIEVIGETDGIFDVADYILFYATGPVSWKYNTSQKIWEHGQNLYSDSAYYYITASFGRGKRISILPNSSLTPTGEVTSYDYRAYHEKDVLNLIKSGRSWYGETFDIFTSYSISFEVPDLIPGSTLYIKTATAARATSASSFSCNVGSNSWMSEQSAISTYYNSPFASGAASYKQLIAHSSPVDIKIQYNKSTSTALGWLDYIDLTARCALKFSNGQLGFRDIESVGEGKIARYRIANAANKAVVWDVTDPINVRRTDTQVSGEDLIFMLTADTLREFVAFDINNLIVPRFVSNVLNQDLHSMQGVDMVIVAPPVFYDQAARLATYHATADDLGTIVVSPELIYNEFSSGSPDVIAIRDFMKMLYDRGGNDTKPRYLLLFGDGSYDNKNRLSDNTNFIPTWQTPESFDPVRSGVSDDYFGILDDNEGATSTDPVDIGIGRLPVKTAAEAEAMVDKIIHYSENTPAVMGDWRNIIAFVADDEDGNEHVSQADNMATYIEESFGNFNIDKIYLDAYLQVATTSGARYPEVNKAITQRVEKGCLILNYTGHGGETGWAHEQVLEVQDINGWSNYSNMPVFVTATCEFSRFDDPGRTSAGELVLLNERGGGIALFTTTRPTYGSPNFELNKSFYKFALNPLGFDKTRMGDIMKDAKRESGSDENGRKFILLGDPAQAIAFPSLKVITTSINSKGIGAEPDTLMAYAQVTISGQIRDLSGTLVNDFNGLVFPTIFDKKVEQNTLGNDGGTSFAFTLQKSILYKGKVQVTGGQFSFTFIVPRDIAYRFDYGKISYYASDGVRDASGDYSNVVVGGSAGNQITDNTGPEISLFMNDKNFNDGGITDENPWLIANVTDENGINTIGSGIGHDLTAVLDGRNDEPYILNDYYESDVNTFRSGSIRFPFSLLKPGEHQLVVKVWDIYNNSSEATIRFTVHASKEFVMQNARNYPNPFVETTNLVFEHNQQGVEMHIRADIYTLSGQLICTLEQTSLEDGAFSGPIRWDGHSSDGGYVSPGMYLYTLTATTSKGLQAKTNGKLIYSK